MSKRILLVDDDPTVGLLVGYAVDAINEKRVIDSNVELMVCDSSDSAIKALQDNNESGEKIDLILLDNRLERKDGRLRRGFDVLDESGTKIPFYMITSDADVYDEAGRHGCSGFIKKQLLGNDILVRRLITALQII